MVKLTISMPEEKLQQIKTFCKNNELKISGFFRLGAKRVLEDDTQ